MRLIIGLLSTLSVATTYANCMDQETAKAQLACFDRVASCRTFVADEARLQCYQNGGLDRAVSTTKAPISANSGLTAQATPDTVLVEAAFPAPKTAQQNADEITPEIHSTITALQKDARGYFYLQLANGHVWREKESVRNRYVEGDAIVIKKGALNSNQLTIVDKGRMVRVERVK